MKKPFVIDALIVFGVVAVVHLAGDLRDFAPGAAD
jgi:hypothetical protein